MMEKPKILDTRHIPQAGLDVLREACEVELNPDDHKFTPEELRQRVADKEGLVCLLTDTIDDALLAAGPRLKVVSNVAVGFDNVDVKAATKRGIVVCNTPGVLTETTADLTWALLMAVARRLVEGDRFVRADEFKEWLPMLLLGGDIFGKTLGIIGMGRIGTGMARRAAGFEMRILYHDAVRNTAAEREYRAEFVSLRDLLQQSDFVTVHVPLLPETRHLISRDELTLMKPTAYLINTSRGPVVDEAALVEALRERRIAGAGLDVYEDEPDLAPGLAELENTVLLPHLGSASVETRDKMATLAAENCLAVLAGKHPPHAVNPEVLG